ncbi:MAG: hypothetical protein KDC34_13510 [Saprospiraceae bacterium]|nr:hypothetical protein [Saprospiraceae bacterium]
MTATERPISEDFLNQMQLLLGSDFDAFRESLDMVPPVSLRLHSRKGMTPNPDWETIPWIKGGYYLPSRPVFTLDPVFHAGAYYVQEASSMLLDPVLRQLLEDQKPVRVLDLCGAPGGKSTLIASLLPAGSLLVTNEVIQSRGAVLRQNMEKWGFSNQIVTQLDARDFAPLAGFFDLILVDAPCSGEGLFRKDLNARSEWSPEHVHFCAGRQKRILNDCVPLLAPGGHLVYSTCTYNASENELNAAWLQAEYGLQVYRAKLDPSWGLVAKQAGYQAYPHKLRGEGFYFSVFTRETGTPFQRKRQYSLPTDWALAGKKQIPLWADWLEAPMDFAYLQHSNGSVRFFPAGLQEDVLTVLGEIGKGWVGTSAGQLKGKSFIPDQALAWSLHLSATTPAIELSRDKALQFLKGESFQKEPDWPIGWQLIRYQGFGLGWVKVLPNRINNYLPKSLRIRMAIS